MWIIKSKEGILTSSRLLSEELIENSFKKVSTILENDTIVDEYNFYEDFVPFLKNLSAIVEFFNSKDHLSSAYNILSEINQKCNWIDKESINSIMGEIKAFNNCNSDDYIRRRNSLKGAIRGYLKKLVAKTGVANKIHSFMNDYNRIVYSPAFRRLQDKAQVFPLEQHDYARTRLTHSIEVSSIAAQLGNITAIKMFSNNNNNKKDIAFQFEKILSCAALLHDIGNPPFGHFGEDAIKNFFEKNYDNLIVTVYAKNDTHGKKISCFKNCNPLYDHLKTDFTRFDGNAQSFRIAVKTQMYKPGHALELTAGVLGAIIKYPFISNYEQDIWKKSKFGYFYSEKKEYEILKTMNVTETNKRNPLVLLLEAADDICYVTSDLDDAIKKNILTYEILNKELESSMDQDNSLITFKERFYTFYQENKNISSTSAFELTMQRMLNDLRIQLIGEVSEAFLNQKDAIIHGINVVKTNNQSNSLKPYSPNYKDGNCYELLECIESAKLVSWLKKLFPKYIYNDRSVIKNELMGYEIITFLLNEFVDAVLKLDFKKGEVTGQSARIFAKQNRLYKLISPNFVDTFKKEVSSLNDNEILEHVYYRLKLVIDYISGMTDSYAKEIYETLRGIK